MHAKADFERADSSAHPHYTVLSTQLRALGISYFVDSRSTKHHENGKLGLECGNRGGKTSSVKERKA